ncbi:MAG: hypothetical protein KY468_05750 [Armatimonadetes bacterium]|nr:hypothetical protein [Armatimonadota bacterium]
MAVYCPRCGTFNRGQGQACITCLGPVSKGQSVPEDAKCATHANNSPLGRCMVCGKATCFDCGSMVDGQILCFTDAAAAATTTAETATGTPKDKKGFSFGKKK